MAAKLLNPHEWYLGFQGWIGANPAFRELQTYLPLRARDMRDQAAVQRAHLGAMIRTLLDERVNTLFTEAIAAYQTEVLGVEPVAGVDDEAVSDACARLDADGYVILPQIPGETVAAMLEWVRRQPVRGWSDTGSDSKTIPLDDARQSTNVAELTARTAVNCPHLLALATDPLRLGIAARWCGTRPTILLTLIWWSFAGRDGAKDAQLFHLDLDDHRFCKFFVYLTDVGEEDGPHVFVPGSHRHDFLLRAAERARDTQAFQEWLFKKLRKTDEEVAGYFDTEPVSLTGPPGTNFIAATRGIHKGLMPLRDHRLVCQVVYGASPFLQTARDPQPIGTPATDNVPAALAEPPRDFTTRFMLRSK